MTNYAFVDLDNVQIYADSTMWWPKDNPPIWPPAGAKIHEHKFRDGSTYKAILRPGALDFLAKLRNYPNTEVYMLTSSVTEYANVWDKAFGLGFGSMRIFAREDMAGIAHLDPKAFPNARTVTLFDDLPEFEHRRGKLPFIGAINPPTHHVNYIKVPYYNGVGALTTEMADELIRNGLELS